MTVVTRRTDTEPAVVGSLSDTMRRYYDEVHECTIVKLFTGGCHVTSEPAEVIVTILGSCIAACVRDPFVHVGGMNHFLLPGDHEHGDMHSMRFGAFAMETLLNELLKRGARKERLEVKLFGGGNVVAGLSDVGARNIAFIRQFLRTENIGIAVEDVGGPYPRRIHYYPDTGKVMVRKLRRTDDLAVAQEEQNYLKKISRKPAEGSVELFI